MSVFQRGKVFHYDFVLKGERYRGSTGQTTKKNALKFELAEKEKARKGLIGTKKSIELSKAYDAFVKIPRKNTRSAQREQNYRSKYNDFVAFMAGEYPKITTMNQVTQDHAEEYIYQLQDSGRYDKTISYKSIKGKEVTHAKAVEKMAKATINDYIMVLKMMFKSLKNKANIHKNPFAEIPQLTRDSESREAFTIEELKLIGEKSKDTPLYPLFITGICTGLRESDICTLKNSEVNLKTNWITRKQDKTSNTVTIPIMAPLRSYLLSLDRKGEYIFPELAARYLCSKKRSKIGHSVTVFLESIGIESNREVKGRSRRVSVRDIHSLRHTFAYMSALANIPLPIVQSVLGHMDTKMTQMYMNHASAQAKQKYLAALPDYLNTGEGADVLTNEYIIEKLEGMTADNWTTVKESLITAIKTQVIH